MPTSDDIWYALAHTEVIIPPRQRLETFGTTVIHYHLLSEKMDSVDEIRVREGQLCAERPQVLTPAYFQKLMLEGFGESAGGYVDWLTEHIEDLAFLKYGFRFRKENCTENIVHESMATSLERVKSFVESQNDPLRVVLTGVDDAWEICLLKFMTDTIRSSAPGNFMDLKKRKMLDRIDGISRSVREEIEGDFYEVGCDAEKMKQLGEKLREYGIFEAYEDQFFDVVRRVKQGKPSERI